MLELFVVPGVFFRSFQGESYRIVLGVDCNVLAGFLEQGVYKPEEIVNALKDGIRHFRKVQHLHPVVEKKRFLPRFGYLFLFLSSMTSFFKDTKLLFFRQKSKKTAVYSLGDSFFP